MLRFYDTDAKKKARREEKAKVVRRVRSVAGMIRFNQPMNSIIEADPEEASDVDFLPHKSPAPKARPLKKPVKTTWRNLRTRAGDVIKGDMHDDKEVDKVTPLGDARRVKVSFTDGTSQVMMRNASFPVRRVGVVEERRAGVRRTNNDIHEDSKGRKIREGDYVKFGHSNQIGRVHNIRDDGTVAILYEYEDVKEMEKAKQVTSHPSGLEVLRRGRRLEFGPTGQNFLAGFEKWDSSNPTSAGQFAAVKPTYVYKGSQRTGDANYRIGISRYGFEVQHLGGRPRHWRVVASGGIGGDIDKAARAGLRALALSQGHNLDARDASDNLEEVREALVKREAKAPRSYPKPPANVDETMMDAWGKNLVARGDFKLTRARQKEIDKLMDEDGSSWAVAAWQVRSSHLFNTSRGVARAPFPKDADDFWEPEADIEKRLEKLEDDKVEESRNREWLTGENRIPKLEDERSTGIQAAIDETMQHQEEVVNRPRRARLLVTVRARSGPAKAEFTSMLASGTREENGFEYDAENGKVLVYNKDKTLRHLKRLSRNTDGSLRKIFDQVIGSF